MLERATDAARSLMDQSTPKERQAQKNAELQRLADAVKDAKKEVEAHLGAAHRGDVDAATRQHTLQVLASKVQDATAAHKAFAETV
jgi:soluble cytochrome b562